LSDLLCELAIMARSKMCMLLLVVTAFLLVSGLAESVRLMQEHLHTAKISRMSVAMSAAEQQVQTVACVQAADPCTHHGLVLCEL
jgi:hypothetical protein